MLLFGNIANDEILNFDGGLCFMLSQFAMVANPCADFSRALTWICEIALHYNANKWGPLVTAAYISSGSQLRPTETGYPTHAYFSNKFDAGYILALHLENIRPHNFPLMTPSVPVNSSSNWRWSSANAIADLFFHQCCWTLSSFGVGCTAVANALNLRFLLRLVPDR